MSLAPNPLTRKRGEGTKPLSRSGGRGLRRGWGNEGQPEMTTAPSVHPVDEILPYGQMAAVGLQHVLVMYAGAIAVPLIVGGVVTVLVAPFASRLVRYFPPLVTGTIITVIGITLLRIGINWAGGGVGAKNFGDPINLSLVALVLATILVINKLFTGFVANIAVLLGLIIGFAAAMALGMVDFAGVYDAGWVALVYPFRF